MRLNLEEGVILRWGRGAFESRGGGSTSSGVGGHISLGEGSFESRGGV